MSVEEVPEVSLTCLSDGDITCSILSKLQNYLLALSIKRMVLANILVFKKTLCAHFTLRYIFNRIKCLLFCVDFYSLYILFGHINF